MISGKDTLKDSQLLHLYNNLNDTKNLSLLHYVDDKKDNEGHDPVTATGGQSQTVQPQDIYNQASTQ